MLRVFAFRPAKRKRPVPAPRGGAKYVLDGEPSSSQSHSIDYILEDNTIKRITPPKIGATQHMVGELQAEQAIIHFEDDRIPEPIDNIHTFQVQFPTPGVVNTVPTSDDDFLLLPRVTNCKITVSHRTVAVEVLGGSKNATSASKKNSLPEMRGKSCVIWATTDDINDYQRANPEFNVRNKRDLLMKYQPHGAQRWEIKGQKVSIVDYMNFDNAGLAAADTPEAKYEKMVEVMRKRAPDGKTYMPHFWQFNMDYNPEPEQLTASDWANRGQCYGNNAFIHLWLENGVWDEHSTIYFDFSWVLQKVMVKDIWFWKNKYSMKEKMIEDGSFLRDELDAYKDKQQLIYTVYNEGRIDGPDAKAAGDGSTPQEVTDNKYFLWNSFVTEGKMVQKLSVGMYATSADEEKGTELYGEVIDPAHPEYIDKDGIMTLHDRSQVNVGVDPAVIKPLVTDAANNEKGREEVKFKMGAILKDALGAIAGPAIKGFGGLIKSQLTEKLSSFTESQSNNILQRALGKAIKQGLAAVADDPNAYLDSDDDDDEVMLPPKKRRMMDDNTMGDDPKAYFMNHLEGVDDGSFKPPKKVTILDEKTGETLEVNVNSDDESEDETIPKEPGDQPAL